MLRFPVRATCMAFRKSRMALPRDEPTSARRAGPKMRRPTKRMMTSSDTPIPPRPMLPSPPAPGRYAYKQACRFVFGFLVLLLVAGGLKAAWASSGSAHLAGFLPAVEATILDGLRREELDRGVVRIAADTNGFLTVAAVTVALSGAPSLSKLETYVGRLVRTAFRAVPFLDEVDVTVLGRHPVSLADLEDVIFTAAASRSEVLSAPVNLPPADLVRELRRVWAHPLLERPTERLREASRAQLGFGEGSPALLHTALGTLRDLSDRLRGHLLGQVVSSKLYRASRGRRAVALTFDDGPLPLYTPLLLDTLGRLGLRATFFLIGRRVEQYPYFAAALVQSGHELGNHSYSHRNLTGLSFDVVHEDLRRAQEAIFYATGHMPRLFRPPGGRYDPTVVNAATALGMLTVLWTDNPGDFQGLPPQRLKTRLLSRIYSGGIILLHQGMPQTLRILPEVSQVLHRLGYTVTTVTGLLHPTDVRARWPSHPPSR